MIPLLLALTACEPAAPSAPWWQQREPGGSCWEVDLSDGLSQESTDELHALYGCLNQDHNFDALAGIDEAMDARSRADLPLGIEVGGLTAELLDQDVDVFGLAGTLGDLLQMEDRPIEPALQIAVELIYAEPYARVASGSVELKSETALDQGVLAPLVPVLATTAGAILDDGDDIPELMADALESPVVDDLVCTQVALAQDDDADVARATGNLLPDLGAALDDARSPDNDRWSGATGDSARDLAEALLLRTQGDGKNAFAALSPQLEELLGDRQVRDGLYDLIDQASDRGDLEDLPLWVLHLASVDAAGQPLCEAGQSSGCSQGDSALEALLRLLASANVSMECPSLGLDGNLAVTLLQLLADLEPETVEDLTSLTLSLLGWAVSDDLLVFFLDECGGVDDPEQLVDDLDALDRLLDPESGQTLELLVELLAAFYNPDIGLDRLQTLADTIEIVHARELVPPTEEVLRDLASSALVSDVVILIPTLLDADRLDTTGCPDGAAPLSWDGTLDLVSGVLTAGDRAEAPIATLQPVLNSVLGSEGTWTAVGNLARLLQEEDAAVQDLAPVLDSLIVLDPDLSLIHGSADLLREDALVEPALRVVENDELYASLTATELSQEGPLPFVARLVTGGTAETLLRTLDLVLASLSED